MKSFKKKLIDARKEMNNPARGGVDAFKKRKYVTLQDLYDAVLPALLDEGLILTNTKEIRDEKLTLVTKIEDCDSAEFIETIAVLNSDLKIQEQGSELTYHSRYNLGCLLSIRTDFDDDGASANKPKDLSKKILQVRTLLAKLDPEKREYIEAKIGNIQLADEKKLDEIIKYLESEIRKSIGVSNGN